MGGHDQWGRLLRRDHLLLGCPQRRLVWRRWTSGLEKPYQRVLHIGWEDLASVTAVVQIVVYHSACLFQLLAGSHLRGGTRWHPASRANSTGPVLLVPDPADGSHFFTEVRDRHIAPRPPDAALFVDLSGEAKT